MRALERGAACGIEKKIQIAYDTTISILQLFFLHHGWGLKEKEGQKCRHKELWEHRGRGRIPLPPPKR